MRGTEGTGWQVANEIAKPQVSINCNIHQLTAVCTAMSAKNCNPKWKFATGNRN